VLGDVATLGPVIDEERVHRTIVAPRGAVSDDLLKIRRLKSLGVGVSVLPGCSK
jgi:hypothetical protein